MILRLARRSILSRPLVFTIAVGILAMSTGLFFGAAVLPEALEKSLSAPAADFDAVLGPRGSKAQLVLSTVFHLDAPSGTIPLAELKKFETHPAVAAVYPVTMGDNYEGFRLVGCRADYVRLYEVLGDELNGFDGASDHPSAIIGAYAAAATGLQVGDHFSPKHGLSEEVDHRHEGVFHVAAVLPLKGHPVDRLILVPLQALQTLDGHRAEAESEVSAILFKLRAGGQMRAMQLDRDYNRAGGSMTLAWPIPRVIADMIASLAWVPRLATAVAVVFGAVAVAALFGLTLLLAEMQRGLLVQLRMFGCSRMGVVGFLFGQTVSLAIGGYVLGCGGFLILAAGLSQWLLSEHGVWIVLMPSLEAFLTALGVLGAIALTSMAWPLWQAYRLDLEAQMRSFEL